MKGRKVEKSPLPRQKVEGHFFYDENEEVDDPVAQPLLLTRLIGNVFQRLLCWIDELDAKTCKAKEHRENATKHSEIFGRIYKFFFDFLAK